MVIDNKDIPCGIPKSGRFWKTKQISRASALLRTGMLKNQSKTFEKKEFIRQNKLKILELERSMIEASKQEREDEKNRRLERKKRIMEAEYKSSSYQIVILT